MMTTTASLSFSRRELGIACGLALGVQGAFFALLIWAGESKAQVTAEEEPKPEYIPIAVQPVLDELPLLKLGSKQKAKLPDIWKKQAPVQRFEERSAPSDKAKNTTENLPTSELADKDHKAPPEDAEIAKQVDQQLEDAEKSDEPAMQQEGAADGVKEGTETDPLKARAIDLYRVKILSWFNARFRPPTDSVPCETLKTLSAGVSVQVGGSRAITSFSISSPSGNAAFDARVESTLRNLVGQELPPPPPLYPDILGSTVFPRLSGAGVTCSSSPAPAAPSEGSGGE